MNPSELKGQVRRDMAEVADQLAAGELDEVTAERLLATYEAEIVRLSGVVAESADAVPARRSRGRLFIGAIVLLLTFAGITWAASGALVDREPDAFSAPQRDVDLDAISNQQMIDVINANASIPEVNRMRLALAERYFEAGEYSDALIWFRTVLDSGPTPTEESEALARIGWMILDSGDPDTALQFVDMALEANPSNLEATYFRGLMNARLGRTQQALADLRTVAASPDVPDEIQNMVADAIANLEAGS